MSSTSSYYVPHSAPWPIVGSIALFGLLCGLATLFNQNENAIYLIVPSVVLFVVMLCGWFSSVISENQRGAYGVQEDLSFRFSMLWFIFSEIMFFSAFFGVLFYVRALSGPWLGGEGDSSAIVTNHLLWSNWDFSWPSNGPAHIGGAFDVIAAWGVPALNTAILLTSGVTVTIAHHLILKDKVGAFIFWMFATVALGAVFVCFQAWEYQHAYRDLNLTLNSGIYGSTFYILTGFHGLHVTLGAIMLAVVTIRAVLGHLSSSNHFSFEAAAWYWHFVDVVWLGLFIFVYIL